MPITPLQTIGATAILGTVAVAGTMTYVALQPTTTSTSSESTQSSQIIFPQSDDNGNVSDANRSVSSQTNNTPLSETPANTAITFSAGPIARTFAPLTDPIHITIPGVVPETTPNYSGNKVPEPGSVDLSTIYATGETTMQGSGNQAQFDNSGVTQLRRALAVTTVPPPKEGEAGFIGPIRDPNPVQPTSVSTIGNSASGGGSSTGGGGSGWKADEGSNICYKYSGSPGGSNVHEGVVTCNQGFIWSGGSHPVPVHQSDCGDPKATICNEGATQAGGGMNYACLWQACRKGRNAIWDKNTKRCGCDDGGGGSSFASSSGGDGASTGGGSGDDTPGTSEGSGGESTDTGSTSAGTGTDAENRARLANSGIGVNGPESQTSLNGLQDRAMDDLESMRTVYKGPMVITGGSEDGHMSDGHGKYMLDFGRNDELNQWIVDNHVGDVREGNLGPVYDVRMPNGDMVVFMDETSSGGTSGNWSRHWHANFPKEQ